MTTMISFPNPRHRHTNIHTNKKMKASYLNAIFLLLNSEHHKAFLHLLALTLSIIPGKQWVLKNTC